MKRTTDVHILLVEDNPADVILMEEALAETGEPCQLRTVSNGDNALACLRRQGCCAGGPPIDLVLLDLNLPGRHGHEVLAEIKQDDELRHIPVLIFSSSASQEDIRTSYRQYASSHITKPADLNDFIRVVKSLVSYWINTAELPRMPQAPFTSDQAPYGTANHTYTALRG